MSSYECEQNYIILKLQVWKKSKFTILNSLENVTMMAHGLVLAKSDLLKDWSSKLKIDCRKINQSIYVHLRIRNNFEFNHETFEFSLCERSLNTLAFFYDENLTTIINYHEIQARSSNASIQDRMMTKPSPLRQDLDIDLGWPYLVSQPYTNPQCAGYTISLYVPPY